MREYWITYDPATGEERFRGEGNEGDAARQMPPDDLKTLKVPYAAVKGATDIEAVKLGICADVDAQAEAIRQRFITPGSGQAMTYQYKADEARAFMADNDAETPFLSAEAAATGKTVEEVAGEVLAQLAAWIAIGSQIEALRMKAKADIALASNLSEIVEASTVDWSGIEGE